MSLGLLSEAFEKPGNILGKIESGKNTSDILTKALGPEVHARHSHGLSVDLEFAKDVLTATGAVAARAFWLNVRRGDAQDGTIEALEAVVRILEEAADDLAKALRELLA